MSADIPTGDITITRAELERLEAIIREGQATFLSVGQALIEIHTLRGYRLRGFETFEAYCQKTFGFTARHGRRLISAANVANTVKQITGHTVKSEGAARRVNRSVSASGHSLTDAPLEVVAAALKGATGTTPPSPRVGKCPYCGRVPSAYWRVRGRWKCGACGKQVSVTAKAVRVQEVDDAEQAARNDFDPEPLPTTKSLPVTEQPSANPSHPVRAKVSNEWNSTPPKQRRNAGSGHRFCKCGVLLPTKVPDLCPNCGRSTKK